MSELEAVERTKMEAEAAAAAALAVKYEAEARKAAADARSSLVDAEQAEMSHRRVLASDAYNHVYRFDGKFDDHSCNAAISTLTEWSRIDPGCDITVVFNSPGGSVFAGFALWDEICTLKSCGHHVTTVARGMAASMGGIVLQAGNHRVAGAESWILIHEISTGAIGKVSELADEVEFAKRMTERVLDIFAARCNLSKTQLRNRMSRKDWWISSTEALEFGLIDEIA